MEHRPLGATGLEVSAIGFGCQEIGGGYGDIEEREFARAVGRALDLGINCFDTAEAYGFGASEQALGRALGAGATRRSSPPSSASGTPTAPTSATVAPSACTRRSTRACRTSAPTTSTCTSCTGPTATRRSRRRSARSTTSSAPARRASSRVSNFTLDELQACADVRRVDVAQYGLSLFDRRMEPRDPLVRGERHRVHRLRRARLRAAERHAPRRPRLPAPTTGARSPTSGA